MPAPVLDVSRPETAHSVGVELAASTATLASKLADVSVIDLLSLEQAVADRAQLGQAVARVQEFFAPFKQMAHRLHRALCDRENEIVGPLLALDRAKRDAISTYKAEQDRLRQERERAIAEEQRRAREAAAAAEAAAFETTGDHEQAAAVLHEALTAPAPVVALPDATRDIAGLKFVRRWHWRYAGGPTDTARTPPDVVTRTMKLIPREFLIVDEKKVGAYARSMKASGRIPGIDIYFVDEPVR